MKKLILQFLLLSMAGMIFVPVSVEAVTKAKARKLREEKKERQNNTETWSAPVPRYMITGGFVLGKILGEASDFLESSGGDSKLYGFDFAAEYGLSPKASVGLRYGMHFVVWNFDLSHLRIRSISLQALYRFRPESRSSFYLKPEVGRSKIWHPYRDNLYSSDQRTFVKLGLGQVFRTRERTDTRVGIFYKYMFTDDADPRIEFNTSYVGLEVSFGYGL